MVKNSILCLLFFAMTACNYSQQKSLQLDPTDGSLGTDAVGYQIISEKVLQDSCVTCHSSAGGNFGGVNLEGYTNVFKKRDRIKARVLERSMPPSGNAALSPAQVQLLVAWIDAGAPESGGPVTSPPVATPAPPVVVDPPPADSNGPTTYEMIYKQIIAPSCLKCHSAGADVNLETYQNLFDLRDAVRAAIEDGSMPRRSKLTEEQKKLIIDWIDAGAPETQSEKPITEPETL